MSDAHTHTSTWFQRFLLPGFAFKAVVIGGGYATGREVVVQTGEHRSIRRNAHAGVDFGAPRAASTAKPWTPPKR